MFMHLISVVRQTDRDQLFRKTKGHLLVTRSVIASFQEGESVVCCDFDSG